MRKLQYYKIYELLDTLQETVDILTNMNAVDEKEKLISDMIFYVDKIIQYVEGIANADQLAAALKQLGSMLSSGSECIELSEQVNCMKEKLSNINIERTNIEEFREETNFSRYIDLLFQAVEDGYSIIIASMDTPCGSQRFTNELGEKLRMLGSGTNLSNKWRASYCAVIERGQIDEKISDTHSVSMDVTLGNAEVFVKSAGMQKVDSPRMCSVTINGKERAVKRRGLSFVIYDKENDRVVDSVNFDTFSENMNALRPGMLPALEEFMDNNPGVVFINVGYPSFPKENLSENEKRIISRQIHYSTFYQNPMLPSPLQKYIKEPSGILEVLSPPHSYVGTDGARHFEDREGKYLNIMNGHRLTYGQPKTFKRTIYIVGGCGIFGIGVRDEGTLASQLQKLLNIYAPEEGFNVENYGFALDGTNVQSEILDILKSLPLKAGDIVAGIGNGKIVSYNKELEVRPYRSGELFFDDMHVTETAHGLVAEGLLETLKENEFFRDRLREKQPSCQISKGSYHLSEEQLSELEEYKKSLVKLYSDYPKAKNLVGAIVMNCNPFTLGHRYLIETCAEKCDMLIVFVVQEDKSYFPFEDRLRLVQEGCSDLENVCVTGSGKFILSSLTFSEYFNKAQLQDRIVDSSEDITLFVNEIVPAANIKVRFAGTEPLDTVTNQYNRTMEAILSQHGIRFEEVSRIEKNGEVISASRVRKLLESRDWELIQELVPDTTLSYLKGKFPL